MAVTKNNISPIGLGANNAHQFVKSIQKGDRSLSLFLGSPEPTGRAGTLNTAKDQIDAGSDATLYSKISADDVKVVARRVKWSQGSPYYAWNPEDSNTGKNYYLTTPNGSTYLVLANNPLNNKEFNGTPLQPVANVMPTHQSGIVTEKDGYSYLFLFREDLGQKNSVNFDKFIAVPDAFDFSDTKTKTGSFATKALQICPTGAGQTGSCCLYAREGGFSQSKGATFGKSDLVMSFSCTTCMDCDTIANCLDLESTFTEKLGPAGSTCSSCPNCDPTKTTKTDIEKLAENIFSYNPNSTAYSLINTRTAGGRIISCEINLSGLTDLQKRINVSNPVIPLLSSSGSNATIRLLTERTNDASLSKDQQRYLITGIKIENNGSGYSDFTVDLSDVSGVNNNTVLENAITIGMEPIGGFNLRQVLEATRVSVTASLDYTDIANNTDQTEFYKFGLIEGAQKLDGTVLFSDKNVSEKSVVASTTKFTARASAEPDAPALSVVAKTTLFSVGTSLKPKTAPSAARDKIVASTQTSSSVVTVELATAKPENFKSGTTLTLGGSDYIITNVTQTPEIKANTGKNLHTGATKVVIPSSTELSSKGVISESGRKFRANIVLNMAGS